MNLEPRRYQNNGIALKPSTRQIIEHPKQSSLLAALFFLLTLVACGVGSGAVVGVEAKILDQQN